ncbi:MAG: hypothetical protein DMG97_42550 [Acidobacteria bacterium]|jgi:hypothetical protein|nr:MAG: hypothetical protein DMG97_42550 [Acidobacteriota bacterium]
MNKATEMRSTKTKGDVVLQEVWRAKDVLSAQYGHDLDKLFSETRKREKLSGHPLVEPPKRRRKAR